MLRIRVDDWSDSPPPSPRPRRGGGLASLLMGIALGALLALLVDSLQHPGKGGLGARLRARFQLARAEAERAREATRQRLLEQYAQAKREGHL